MSVAVRVRVAAASFDVLARMIQIRYTSERRALVASSLVNALFISTASSSLATRRELRIIVDTMVVGTSVVVAVEVKLPVDEAVWHII